MSGHVNFSMTRQSDSVTGNNDTLGSTDPGTQPMEKSGTWGLSVMNSTGKSRTVRLETLAKKHEIRVTERDRLMVLADYEIVILCDDSGSMNMPVDGTNRTRWDELRCIVKLVIEIATIFDMNGVDVYFLNREGTKGITDSTQIDSLFTLAPSGYTPLASKLQEILKFEKTRPQKGKKVLIFIATDGTPTDGVGNSDLQGFKQVMMNERKAETTHVMFLLCTDESDCIDYLTTFKRTMKNVGIYDDYETEKKKMRRLHGDNYTLSRGDYIVQALVGAVERKN